MLGRQLEAGPGLKVKIDVEQIGERRHRRTGAEGCAGDDGQPGAALGEHGQGVAVVVAEGRRRLLGRLGQRHPELVARQAAAVAMDGLGKPLGVDDAGAGRHPVDLARPDGLDVAGTVAVNDFTLEQVGERRQADVRVRPHVLRLSGAEHHRSDLVEEDERPNHAPQRRGQGAPHLEATDVAHVGQNDVVEAAPGRPWNAHVRSLLLAPLCRPPAVKRRDRHHRSVTVSGQYGGVRVNLPEAAYINIRISI